MKTRVLRIDMAAEEDLAVAIAQVCDKQLAEGFRLAATFTIASALILIFQS